MRTVTKKKKRVNSPNLHGYQRRTESLAMLGFTSYADYLRSDLWKKIRARVLRLNRGACRSCSNPATEVHHRHYSIDVMSGEDIRSLAAVCRNCHKTSEFHEGTKTKLGTANKRLKDLRCPPTPECPKGATLRIITGLPEQKSPIITATAK